MSKIRVLVKAVIFSEFKPEYYPVKGFVKFYYFIIYYIIIQYYFINIQSGKLQRNSSYWIKYETPLLRNYRIITNKKILFRRGPGETFNA